MSSLTQYALTAHVSTTFDLPDSVLNHADLRTVFPYLDGALRGLDATEADPLSQGLVIELANAFDAMINSIDPVDDAAIMAAELFADEAKWGDAAAVVDSDLQIDQVGKVSSCQPLVQLLQRRKQGEEMSNELIEGLMLGRLTVLEIAQEVESRQATIADPHGDDVIDAPNGTEALVDEIEGALGSESLDFDSISASEGPIQVPVTNFSPLRTTMEAVKAIEGTHSVKIWLNADNELVLSGKLRCNTIDPAILTMISAAFGNLNSEARPEFRPSGNNEIIFQAPID